MFLIKSITARTDNHPDHYVLEDKALENAVNMSIWLQKPLLLTGAPGCGKTQLAYKVASELTKQKGNFAPFEEKPFKFSTKTTSSATDLFYTYDTISHFQESNISNKTEVVSAHRYITIEALGKAILKACGKKYLRETYPADMLKLEELPDIKHLAEEPVSSVVLIDEIDKAPRDFPNDLLHEIENFSFTIKELNWTCKKADNNAKVIVVMTSNFEKNLPDAFLRRCLFYHIPKPGKTQLEKIVSTRMEAYLEEINSMTEEQAKAAYNELQPKISQVIDTYIEVREGEMEKAPSTSELLEWVKVLHSVDFFKEKLSFAELNDNQKNIIRYTLPIIVKSQTDLQTVLQKYIPVKN